MHWLELLQNPNIFTNEINLTLLNAQTPPKSPHLLGLTQTFLCLTSLQYMHIVKLISSFALFSWQRDKKNKESALVKCPLFPIFSKFCKQSKCHSKFKVGNSLQIVLIGPSINNVVSKLGVFDPLHSQSCN